MKLETKQNNEFFGRTRECFRYSISYHGICKSFVETVNFLTENIDVFGKKAFLLRLNETCYHPNLIIHNFVFSEPSVGKQ